jgi:AMMECR1 domain-containing protein
MTPISDPLSWTLGTHGIHITFQSPNGHRKFKATYLPEIAIAQGWTKEETLVSLVKKSGYRGRVEMDSPIWKEMKVEVYESLKGKKDWKDWTKWKEDMMSGSAGRKVGGRR